LGNLCLESDIIYSRSISFSREVKEDDIIIFPNMAAYHMDFYETESISHPKKIPYTIVNDDLVLDK
jgi:orn/DAP/arg decarboxylase 2